MTDLQEFFLGKVDPDFLPGFAHRRVQATFILLVTTATRERDVRRPLVVLARSALDEQQLGRAALHPR